MLTQPRDLPERIRGVGISTFVPLAPSLRLQRVDGIPSGEEIHIAPTKGGTQLPVLRLRVKADNILPGFPYIRQ